MRKDILEAAKAMVVARERAEEEAGTEVGLGELFISTLSNFQLSILSAALN